MAKRAVLIEIESLIKRLSENELEAAVAVLRAFVKVRRPPRRRVPAFDPDKYFGAFKSGGAKIPTREEIYEERLDKQVPRH